MDDQVTLKRCFRIDVRWVELRPESTKKNPAITADLMTQAFEICGASVGALIGDRFNSAD